jgi:P27 family predicted phage terminase small subunit
VKTVAQRGRKPKPTAIKEIEGNPGKRKLNKNEPKPEKKAPKCPEWLEKEAKNEWDRLAIPLEEMGILTEVDMAAFAGYCQSYARWREAEMFLSNYGPIVKTPSGYWQQVPQVSVSQTNLKLLLKFATEFGLTPSSRSRIIAGNDVPDTDDPMKWILYEGGKKK